MDIPHYGRKRVGIIGAGIAGLHLGLRLRQLGIDCTIMTDRSPDQVASAQLTNTVVHWPATLGRERVLRVYHWPAEEFGFHHRPQGHSGTAADRDTQSRRGCPHVRSTIGLYLPRLMEDFAERGGRLEVGALEAKEIGRIADRFDLVVVATPGNGFARLFARDAALSPYDRPQRYSLAGLFTGFRWSEMRGVILSVVPGHGEAVAFPLLSRTGMVGALAISSRHADELSMLLASCRAARTGRASVRPCSGNWSSSILRSIIGSMPHASTCRVLTTWRGRRLRRSCATRTLTWVAENTPSHWAMCMSRSIRCLPKGPISDRTAHSPWRTPSRRQVRSIWRSAKTWSAVVGRVCWALHAGPTRSCSHWTMLGCN